MITEGSLLWEPTPDVIAGANLTRYIQWLAERRAVHVSSYPQLWRWSVDDIDLFWESLWDFFELQASARSDVVIADRQMPGATWFPGAQLNYAENIFAKQTDRQGMIFFKAEDAPLLELSREEVYEQTRRLAAALRASGVQPGDRVAAYLPNVPETVVAFLATASLGAIWSSCSPDFGTQSVLDRFAQIEPKVLFAVDGYQYGGKWFSRLPVVQQLQQRLPTVQRTILLADRDDAAAEQLSNTFLWDETLAVGGAASELDFVQVPFDHPLWVLYSSGTTGLPKPIVHGHGGMLLEHAKATVLHNDLKPEDRFFWFTSTGWMMWNYVVGSLLSGCSIVLYHGHPAYPDLNTLWSLAETTEMTYFGTSAAYLGACMDGQIEPSAAHDLSRIRAIGSTGSPLAPAGFAWAYDRIHRQLAVESLSGGTDLCTAFVGGARIMPVYAGEIQARSLGADVQSFNEQGKPVTDEVGELVIAQPMPSMPLGFWNDPHHERYRASYFETYPGRWRHGDWIKINQRGGCVIYGRSDATINRYGVRMGTAEFYSAIEALPEICDSLIIDLELLARKSRLLLFVVLADSLELSPGLVTRINDVLRTQVSPRHVPDDIVAIDEVPYTLSGKKMEVPVRKILLGHDPAQAANLGATRNPDALRFFLDFATS